jgi:hypothetical protein
MAKTNNAPAPRRPSEPSIAEAIKPRGVPLDKLLADHAAGSTAPKPAGFAKLSLSVAADLARA